MVMVTLNTKILQKILKLITFCAASLEMKHYFIKMRVIYIPYLCADVTKGTFRRDLN